jgi:anti-sigma B factor antagonist
MAELDDETWLDVTVEPSADPRVIRAAGELDASTAGGLRDAVDGVAAGSPETLVFDLAGVEFIDSSGLAVLLEAAARIPKVVMRSPSVAVLRVVQLTGVDHVLTSE